MTLGMKQSIHTRKRSGTQDGVAICVSKLLCSHKEILVLCINYLIYAFLVLCVVSLLQEESVTDNDRSEGEEGGEIMKTGHQSIIIGQVMQDSQKKGMISAFLLYF
jgi:hypothetical protein